MLLFLWCVLSWSFDLQHIAAGIVIALIISFFAGDIFAKKAYPFFQVSRYFWFLAYIPVFLWDCFKANVAMAFAIIRPEIPLRPGIVKVKTSLKSDAGLTFLANHLTLTRDTIAIDIDAKRGIIYVHWLNAQNTDIEKNTKILVARLEKFLKKVFE